MAMASRERELVVFKSRVAQRVGRLADMVDAVNTLAEQHADLIAVECNLLWAAYRTRFLEKFSSLRAMTDHEDDGRDDYSEFLLSYNSLIKADLKHVCLEAVGVLEHHLLPYAADPENIVLYNSMLGDNYFVLGMTAADEDSEGFLDKAQAAYEASYELASEVLGPGHGHQLRLCVALNLSAFHYDVMNDIQRAFNLVNGSLADSAAAEVTEEGTRIRMQIIDNVHKWMAAAAEGGEAIAEAEEHALEEEEHA